MGADLATELHELTPALAAAAQAVLDGWQQDETGFDEELGTGGACDRIAEALSAKIAESVNDIEIEDGGQDGDDHAFIVVSRHGKRYVVDIPPQIYETGSGYTWKKRMGVTIVAADILIAPV